MLSRTSKAVPDIALERSRAEQSLRQSSDVVEIQERNIMRFRVASENVTGSTSAEAESAGGRGKVVPC